MRCTSYCTASSYDIVALFQSLQKKDKAQLYRNVIHFQKKEENKVKGDIFFFSYGAVVFWGFTEKEELLYLDSLKEFEEQPYGKWDIDEFTYGYAEVMKIAEDRISLQNKSTLTKFAVSHGLAQSVKLAIFEDKIHKTVSQAKKLPDELSRKGKISLSRKAISQKMGDLFRERHYINLSTEIFETPEFFWDHPELEPFYRKTASYLEINKRVEGLNKRLLVMHDLLEILSGRLNHQHSSRLEWTIIILILVEVVMGVFKDILKWI
jgi:uncharacterized Rmd1/YagE family protein